MSGHLLGLDRLRGLVGGGGGDRVRRREEVEEEVPVA